MRLKFYSCAYIISVRFIYITHLFNTLCMLKGNKLFGNLGSDLLIPTTGILIFYFKFNEIYWLKAYNNNLLLGYSFQHK
jgi:hypothetical protein